MAVATKPKITGQRRMFHVHTNACPSPAVSAIFCAIAGPAMTRVIDVRMKIARPTVSPSATRRTFHQGRPSVMS
jgi:hypothetical protein